MMLTFGLMMLAPASAGAFPGRNGKIVFDAPPDGNPATPSQIFVMNPDGTGVQELTYSASTSNWAPVWSPDGTKIAYQSGPLGGLSIWVMNADGSGAYQVTSGYNDFFPDWSPDGSKIAFSRSGTNAGLYFVNAGGTGTPTQLTSGLEDGYPSWSPDGTKIAFARGGTAVHLFVLTVATLSVTQLSISGITFETMPCWSPDGSQIVFVDLTLGHPAIYVVSANGGTPNLILSGFYVWPDWSPDGTKIAYSTGVDSIHVMNADGSNPTDVTPNMPLTEAPNWQRLPPVVAPVGPVGGFLEPVNKLAVFAPYLALFGMVAVVAVVVAAPWKKTHN
jgi:TolB protein